MCICVCTHIHTYMVMSQRIYWISQKCFHCYGVVGFKRSHFKSEILTKSQPITIIRRWATLNQTQSTLQRLPVPNNTWVVTRLILNRALTSHMVKTGGGMGLGRVGRFFKKVREKKGMGGNYHSKRLSASLKQISSGTPTSNWLQARIDRHESLKEGRLTLERWGREVWGNLTIWFYMPRLFHLFIDILTTGSFHLLCKEDFRGLWPGPWEPLCKRFLAAPPCG